MLSCGCLMNSPFSLICPHCGGHECLQLQCVETQPFKCSSCRKRFGRTGNENNAEGTAYDYLRSFQSLLLGVYGWGSTSVRFYVDRNISIAEAREGGSYQYRLFPIKASLRELFLRKLFDEVHILDWDTKYDNRHILDGTQWELQLSMKDRADKLIWGSNQFPFAYDTFTKLLQALLPHTNVRIEQILLSKAHEYESFSIKSEVLSCFKDPRYFEYSPFLTPCGTETEAQHYLCRAVADFFNNDDKQIDRVLLRMIKAGIISLSTLFGTGYRGF